MEQFGMDKIFPYLNRCIGKNPLKHIKNTQLINLMRCFQRDRSDRNILGITVGGNRLCCELCDVAFSLQNGNCHHISVCI